MFDEVIVVDLMDSEDRFHLSLLGRPELGITFTKIHCWTLTQYSKCVFLDADTLVSPLNLKLRCRVGLLIIRIKVVHTPSGLCQLCDVTAMHSLLTAVPST